MATQNLFTLEIDWTADGDFADADENVTADLLAFSCIRGRERASQLTGRSTAGRFQATLLNLDGKYSSFNASSPLFGNVLPGRELRLRAGGVGTGKAAQFTAASLQSLSHVDNAALSVGDIDFTVAGWMYLDSKSDFRALASHFGATPQRSWSVQYSPAATDRFRFLVSGDGTALTSLSADVLGVPSTATWYFVVAWHDATANTINIQINNGTANSTAHTTGALNSTADFQIGGRADGVYMDGRIDAVAFWKRTLTTAEKTWLYNSGAGRSYIELGRSGDGSALKTSLISWWSLEEASGVRHDLHGSNHLTDNNNVGQAAGKTPIDAVLWTGFLDTIVPQAGPLPTVTLSASGPFLKLGDRSNLVSPEPLSLVQTGDVVEAILDAADWPVADRIIDSGAVPVGDWFVERKVALDALQEMEETEMGFLHEGLDWDVVFEARYYRNINSGTSAATISDAAAAALSYLADARQEDPLLEIFNLITATVQPYTTQPLAVIWTLTGETPHLAPGDSITYIARVSGGYVLSWTTPVVGTDITQTGVSNGDIDVDVVTGAQSMQITITNNHATVGAILTLVQARGVARVASNPYQVRAEDVASKALYGQREYPLASPWYPSANYAQAACDYFISQKKDPHPILEIRLPAASDDDLFEEAVMRDLSDRVTVVAEGFLTEFGINGDFFIESIAHEYQAGGALVTAWQLSPAGVAVDYWRLDVHELDTETVLAF